MYVASQKTYSSYNFESKEQVTNLHITWFQVWLYSFK